MDQDSCHYLLHPRGHHSVCHPGPHPVPRLLQVGAGGASVAARAPHAALHLPALPADPPAAPLHHALQPPLQTRGEEEKEVAGSGSLSLHTCAAFGPDPALAESSGTGGSSQSTTGCCKEKWNCLECTALLPPHTALAGAWASPGSGLCRASLPGKRTCNPLMCNSVRGHTHTLTHTLQLILFFQVPFLQDDCLETTQVGNLSSSHIV